MDTVASWRTDPPSAFLSDLLPEGGVVPVVGAGGKKSVIRACARHHPGPVLVTGSVHTAPLHRLGPDSRTREASSRTEALRQARDAAGVRCTCLLGPPARKGRRAPIDLETLSEIGASGAFHTVLVKADGARMRPLKAPREGEPVLPAGVGHVVLVLGASALGAPLDDEHVHRPERVQALTGLAPGERIGPDAVCAILTAPGGYLEAIRGAGGPPASGVSLVINQVDDAEREQAASAVVQRLAAQVRLRGVWLARLKDPARPVWRAADGS